MWPVAAKVIATALVAAVAAVAVVILVDNLGSPRGRREREWGRDGDFGHDKGGYNNYDNSDGNDDRGGHGRGIGKRREGRDRASSSDSESDSDEEEDSRHFTARGDYSSRPTRAELREQRLWEAAERESERQFEERLRLEERQRRNEEEDAALREEMEGMMDWQCPDWELKKYEDSLGEGARTRRTKTKGHIKRGGW